MSGLRQLAGARRRTSRGAGSAAGFDYVIIGAGSAGCVLAERLSADPSVRVLVLEAGPSDLDPILQLPAGMLWLNPDRYLRQYALDPDASRGDRPDAWATGNVVGGGSSVNAMLWVRGNRADYDHWAAVGAEGWDYASLLPTLRSFETFERGEGAFRGGSGGQHVSFVRMRHPLTGHWQRAASQIGLNPNDDYNGASQFGVADAQVSQRRGLRQSAARAFLIPALARPNLTLLTRASAETIRIRDGLATGVRYRRHGVTVEVAATREVVLSAGALATPGLLMRSGVGPAAELERLGIRCVADLPGVGRNLQEHPTVTLAFDVTERTLNQMLTPRESVLGALDFLLRRRGPATAPLTHAVAFEALDDTRDWPTYQAMFSPLATAVTEPDGSGQSPQEVHAQQSVRLAASSTVSVYISLLHPRTRGTVTLASASPDALPRVRFGFLSDPEDVRDLIAACRRVRETFAAPAMAGYVRSESLPGADVVDDAGLENYLRAGTYGIGHWSGTAKMGGVDDPGAVVDPNLRVRGVGALRVADASVMPTITSGNTNAPSMLIGAQAARLIARG